MHATWSQPSLPTWDKTGRKSTFSHCLPSKPLCWTLVTVKFKSKTETPTPPKKKKMFGDAGKGSSHVPCTPPRGEMRSLGWLGASRMTCSTCCRATRAKFSAPEQLSTRRRACGSSRQQRSYRVHDIAGGPEGKKLANYFPNGFFHGSCECSRPCGPYVAPNFEQVDFWTPSTFTHELNKN